MIDLDKLERLCGEATPGPWPKERGWIDETKFGNITECFPVSPGITRAVLYEPDAEFIAEARTALPELVAMVKELREWKQRHEGCSEAMSEWDDGYNQAGFHVQQIIDKYLNGATNEQS